MMAGQHLLRRGAFYYWRKRLTGTDDRLPVFQMSLHTASKGQARRFGMELSWVSERLAIDLSSGRLTLDQVKEILRETARNQALCLENGALLGRTAMVGGATKGVWGETVTAPPSGFWPNKAGRRKRPSIRIRSRPWGSINPRPDFSTGSSTRSARRRSSRRLMQPWTT